MNRLVSTLVCGPIATVVFVTAVSCSKAPSNSSEPQKIAVIISTLNNPWFVVLGETAKARAEELGYEATIFDSQNDTAKETSHFEDVITGGYKAILFNPTDADGSIANVRRAKAADVPVFCIDREINATDAATSQILSDSYSGCVELGKYFVEQVGEEGEYIELLGLPGDNNTWNRSKGFHSVVDRYPNLKMVAQQSADFDRTKALEVMESLLQAHPEIDAVFCGNDAMAMGAYQALVSAGKPQNTNQSTQNTQNSSSTGTTQNTQNTQQEHKDTNETVKVFGFDGADDVVQKIAEGKIVATGMQFPKTMARMSAEFADEWINGKRDFEQKIPVAVELVTQENVSEYGDYGAYGDDYGEYGDDYGDYGVKNEAQR